MAETIQIPFKRPLFPRAALSSDNLEFWIGRQEQIDRVVRGLLAAPESHYLVTGYPGVGKTSFVSRVLAEWRRLCAVSQLHRVLIFNLRFADSQSTEEVVSRLIGKVYFGSVDGQFAPDKQLAQRLQLNFIQARSKMLKERQDEGSASEKGGEATINLPGATAFGGGLKLAVGASKESRRSVEIEREYNLSAVINDFESVIHLLAKPESYKRTRSWKSWWPFAHIEKAQRPRILFVFDQIDDLNRIQALSPLFNMPHASFIVIGGIKLKDQLTTEKEKGIHVLDNFQEEYLPCQWDLAEGVLSLLIPKTLIGTRRFTDYRDYLNFSAQGLPRRLFSALDQNTARKGNEFILRLRDSDLVKARLGARLHRVIWRNRRNILGDYIDSVENYRRDKALRGIYHLADRVFRTAKFTFQEATTVATQMSDAIAHSERERLLKNLLEVCVDEGLITRNQNSYSLSAEILKWVRRIPDWLKDGFVNAQDFLADFTKAAYPGVDETGIVRMAISRETAPRSSVPERASEPALIEKRVPRYLSDYIDGRYRIVRTVGKGGMGTVFLAEDLRLARKVALKVIDAAVGESSDIRSRFLREGRVIARLNHPNIVSVFDMEELPTGELVLVTEFVEGISLESLISASPLSVDETLRVMIETAEALEVAHREGIIHRDVKPSNIIVDVNEHVRLLDFGIAKLTDRGTVSEVTQAGTLIGTPAYMPPEQFRGDKIDGRADIYSLGVVGYEMLTQRKHFVSSSIHEMLYKLMSEIPPPPSAHNPAVPVELDAIILKCLAKNPEDRFKSARELVAALESVRKKIAD